MHNSLSLSVLKKCPFNVKKIYYIKNHSISEKLMLKLISTLSLVINQYKSRLFLKSIVPCFFSTSLILVNILQLYLLPMSSKSRLESSYEQIITLAVSSKRSENDYLGRKQAKTATCSNKSFRNASFVMKELSKL